MILSTSSGGSVRRDTLAKFAELGFTHVCCRSATPTREFERTVKQAHELGIKVIGIFPDWFGLGLIEDEFCFQTADGFTNKHFEGSEGRIEGPSHWHPEPEVRWRPALAALAETGLDGILTAPMHSDRMMPSDFYPFERYEKYCMYYWSFDPWAKKAWAEVSDLPMPERPIIGHDGLLQDMEFYNWYRDSGWIKRITDMADAALDLGLKEIWSWYIALDFCDAENAADATYNSVLPVEKWRQNIISRGGHPVTVGACVAGCWPRWSVPMVETIKQAATNLHWEAIAGAEAWGPDCYRNILTNGKLYHDNNFSGLFCGEGSLVLQFDEAKKTFAQIHEMWKD